jgi:hypothetical protein
VGANELVNHVKRQAAADGWGYLNSSRDGDEFDASVGSANAEFYRLASVDNQGWQQSINDIYHGYIS